MGDGTSDSYDLKKDRPRHYTATRAFQVVDVPTASFLTARGAGDPNTSPLYADVVTALYTLAYAARAVAIAELGRRHVVGPLEGLWWADDVRVFTARDKDAWQWQLMIAQPDWVTPDVVAAGRDRALERADVREADRVGLTTLTEGLCVQVLHVGPYDAEGPTVARMHDDFMPAHGLRPRDSHHEIYLSDPRRTDPGRLRTILRQPVERVDG